MRPYPFRFQYTTPIATSASRTHGTTIAAMAPPLRPASSEPPESASPPVVTDNATVGTATLAAPNGSVGDGLGCRGGDGGGASGG